jgi:hypothetical protein
LPGGRATCCALLASVAIVAGVHAATGAVRSTLRGWHALSVGKSDGVFPLGRASGRVWFVTETFKATYTVWSARVSGGRLTSLVSTSEVVRRLLHQRRPAERPFVAADEPVQGRRG